MSQFLAGVLSFINSVVHNYGWSMVIFTIVIKSVLVPLDYKSRKSMRRMTKLQPEMTKLQKKYANDKDKLNQKTAELYRRAGVSPMSGCLPMLISMVILFVIWDAMRSVANVEIAKQAIDYITTGTQVNEGWLWIKNIWMADSPFTSTVANSGVFAQFKPDVWTNVFATLTPDKVSALAAYGIDANTISSETIVAALQQVPSYAQDNALWSVMPNINFFIAKLDIYANNNGWFVLPILSAVSQYLMTLSQPQQPTADPNSPQAGTNKFMKYFFPLFSLWICSTYNAIFSLYWVVSNLYAWVQSLIMNKMFERAEAKEAQAAAAGEGALK